MGPNLTITPSTPDENDYHTSSDNSPSSTRPSTPGGFLSFTPRRAMTSFENLVALANHQERLKEARRMVWRDKGQPVVKVPTLQDCVTHAATGGLRAGILAFSLRASLNVFLALFRLRSISKDKRIRLIFFAIFGSDSWRFSAMLATFVSTYKFLLNALPILNPPRRPMSESPFADDDERDLESGVVEVKLPRRTARLSLSTQARVQFHLIRKQTRRWHATLAGGVAGGLAILFETKARRVAIGQQLFVRGLQGTYNWYSTNHNIHIPHGDVIVFALSCGQILYAFLMIPDSIPKSYNAWISQASKVSPAGVALNRGLVRENALDMPSLDKLINLKKITPANKSVLENLRDGAASLPLHGPCEAIHPAQTSCWSVPPIRFWEVFQMMLPVYGALHVIPPILFKTKAFKSDPANMMKKAILGTARSSTFLGIFVVIYQSIYCSNHQLTEWLLANNIISRRLLSAPALSKVVFWFAGMMSGLSLFIEEKRRRPELSMYVLPKALESLYRVARGKVGVKQKGGESVLAAIGMAMVMTTYQNDPQHLGRLVRRILYQFIGPN